MSDEKAGNCPRCKKGLQTIDVNEIRLSECDKCEGVWLDVDTFEALCANKENQSAVLKMLDDILKHPKPVKVQYVPCPACSELMNRSNFAKVSGIIIDTCKGHGVWFDANELPQIIEFIRKGGMEYYRQKEKA
jgi:Zn-finger nucleic acid-binding protein